MYVCVCVYVMTFLGKRKKEKRRSINRKEDERRKEGRKEVINEKVMYM